MAIFYNGATGSLGRYLEPALVQLSLAGHPLRARLEDPAGLARELESFTLRPGEEAVLLQLAARVSVPECERDPLGTHQINVVQVTQTVRAFVDWSRRRQAVAKVVFVSTGHVYAPLPPGQRLSESSPTQPRSVYARSKLAAEQSLAQLAGREGFGLVVARVFGLVAPTQPGHYVLPGLLRRVQEGRLEGIPGLDFVRDYLDSRDVCLALLSLAQMRTTLETGGTPGPTLFNLCSGEAVSLRSLLRRIARVLRPEDDTLADRATPGPGRPDDVESIVGDPSRLSDYLGRPIRRLDLDETIRDACAATA